TLAPWRPEVKHAVHVPGMDAVLARCETEEGTESNDLLLQQAETEKRQTDGRNAEEAEDRREQAHGPSVLAERLSPISRTPPAEAAWGRTSALFSFRRYSREDRSAPATPRGYRHRHVGTRVAHTATRPVPDVDQGLVCSPASRCLPR